MKSRYKGNYIKFIFFIFIITILLIILSRNIDEEPVPIEFESYNDKNFTRVSADQKQSRNALKLFNLNFEYLINSKVCNERNSIRNGTDILAVFIVTSYFGNVETRSAMRKALPKDVLQKLKLRRIFLLGVNPKDKYISQNSVQNEAHKFGDIVQGNFKEAYRNLTYKHVMGLKWVSTNCNQAVYVVKMDDDIVVNMLRIVDVLKKLKMPKEFLAGYMLRGLLPKRDKSNKWYVTKEEYSQDKYPSFISGWLYVTTPRTCNKLASLSHSVPYLWIDDVYVTGILAKKLKIKQFDLSQYFTAHSEYIDCCLSDLAKHKYDCDILIGPNGSNPNLFYEFNRAMLVCYVGKCTKRLKLLNETCVAEKKVNLGMGSSIIQNYKLH